MIMLLMQYYRKEAKYMKVFCDVRAVCAPLLTKAAQTEAFVLSIVFQYGIISVLKDAKNTGGNSVHY